MSYKININPVKAVTNLGYSKRDIIGPSDKCYSICSAFSSGDDAYHISPDCARQCDEFIERRKREVYGVGKCDHQAPYRPVIWDNIPRYVAKLIRKGKTPEESLELGKEMCRNVPNLYNECVDLCELDYNAVEKIHIEETVEKPDDNEKVVDHPPPIIQNVKSDVVSNDNSSSDKRKYSKMDIGLAITFSLLVLGLIILISSNIKF